jgi:WD40 repeat protein
LVGEFGTDGFKKLATELPLEDRAYDDFPWEEGFLRMTDSNRYQALAQLGGRPVQSRAAPRPVVQAAQAGPGMLRSLAVRDRAGLYLKFHIVKNPSYMRHIGASPTRIGPPDTSVVLWIDSSGRRFQFPEVPLRIYDHTLDQVNRGKFEAPFEWVDLTTDGLRAFARNTILDGHDKLRSFTSEFHAETAREVCFSSEGRFLIVQRFSGPIDTFDASNGTLLSTFGIMPGSRGTSADCQSTTALVLKSDGSVEQWDLLAFGTTGWSTGSVLPHGWNSNENPDVGIPGTKALGALTQDLTPKAGANPESEPLAARVLRVLKDFMGYEFGQSSQAKVVISSASTEELVLDTDLGITLEGGHCANLAQALRSEFGVNTATRSVRRLTTSRDG